MGSVPDGPGLRLLRCEDFTDAYAWLENGRPPRAPATLRTVVRKCRVFAERVVAVSWGDGGIAGLGPKPATIAPECASERRSLAA